MNETPSLAQSLLSQARLRLGLGMPALLVVVAAVYIFDADHQRFGPRAIAALACAYVAYSVIAFLLARRQREAWSRWLLAATIVGDPLMLSSFLYGAGNAAVVFVGFYLFTILGFGFRVSARSMLACQAAAIIGFTFVVYSSPVWHEMPWVAASHLVLLIVVPLYAAALIRDLRAARERAQYESEAKTRLLANVSHELRTPLTGIISAAQLIEAETRPGELINAKAHSIGDMAWHLDGEISQLLELSKLQLGTTTGDDAVAFTMDHLVSNVVETVQAAAAAKQLTLSGTVDPAIAVPVKGAAQALRGVLINLLGNAVKFTEEGRVSLSVVALESGSTHYLIRFSVTDTGIGIAPEHQSRVFEPFYQVERGSTRRYGGTGLGMAIAAEQVARLGGRIRLESELGRGSTFWFDLPLAKSHARDVGGEAAVVAKPTRSKRVLLADDNTTNLALIREMLTKDGHDVVAVSSGEEALSMLAGERFDLVMLDYNMQDIDGARVWSIYSMSRTDPAPTVFVTADTTARSREFLLSVGAAGIIHKPITFAALRDTMRRLFPDDAVVLPGPSKPARPGKIGTQGSRLEAVAVEYLSSSVLETLAEINPSPAFATAIMTDARNDIEAIGSDLAQALSQQDISAVRRGGHAMKGVALNIGAPRLAAFGERLMTMPFDSFKSSARDLDESLRDEVTGTMIAIDDLLAELGRADSTTKSAVPNREPG